MSRVLNEEAKIWAKYKKNTNNDAVYRTWRADYKRKGILEFAYKELRKDPKNGGELKLSDEQIKFLIDFSEGKTNLGIISAGRGTGKSFSLSILISWFIFVEEYKNIGVLAGNSKQSGVLDEYIKGWIKDNPKLQSFIVKNVEDKIITFANSSVVFCALSDTAVRGIHGSILIIDEEVAAEEAGGEAIVKTAEWTVNTAEHMIIIRSSTPQSAGGYFTETWNEAEERGYTRYQWSSVKHVSGVKDPYKVYTDINPEHWVSNLPWITDKVIRQIRKNKSNDEWLAEALGVMSLSSGMVISPADMKISVCDECEECHPYQGKCMLLQYFLFREGLQLPEMQVDRTDIEANENAINICMKYLGERIIGIDWGNKAPDCYTCMGRFNNQIFILDFKELRGQGTEAKINTTVEMANKWFVETIVPDPEQWAYSEDLANLGYSLRKLWEGGGGQAKETYVKWLKKDFERHRIHIPKAFVPLIKSIGELTYGDDNKIVKRNDHAWDSLLYGRSFYGGVDEDENTNLKNAYEGANLWTPKNQKLFESIRPVPKKPDDKSNIILDFNPFDENYLKKRRDNSSGFENGVNIW